MISAVEKALKILNSFLNGLFDLSMCMENLDHNLFINSLLKCTAVLMDYCKNSLFMT